MFKIHRQPPGEGAVKKSIQKLCDPKKDVGTRLKHLRNVIDNSTEAEVQSVFERHYSNIYFIFFENFLLAESNLRLKGSHRAQRDELDAILAIFEQILINLPDLVHRRWQYHGIDTIIKRLLHTQNSLKVRREGMHFFLLWLRALRESALPSTLLLYACLVPGFPPPTFSDGMPYSLEWLVNMPINEEYGIHQVEIMCLVPPSSGEKQPPTDLTKYFLDALLEFMVLKARVLHWKDKDKTARESFSFLWDLFKQNYLPHAFSDFNFSTSIYTCNLALPEPRESVNYVFNVTDSGSVDQLIEVASGCPMLAARVSIIKWVVAFTGSFERSNTIRPDSRMEALHRQVLKQLQELNGSNVEKESEVADARSSVTTASSNMTVTTKSALTDTDASNSNTSTLTEKDPSISSLSSLDDKLQSSDSDEEEIVVSVLYSTRQNINIVHELFRQAFMLPLTEVPTMRRVAKVYQQWIQDGERPIFMKEPTSQEAMQLSENSVVKPEEAQSSLRNTSYARGQLNPLIDTSLSKQVCAGAESTYQMFITSSAHVFLVEPPPNAAKLVEAQVDVCKRVLNLYRFMVMNTNLSHTTWRQLLRVLLHVTRIMFQDVSSSSQNHAKHQTVAGKLAGPVFQTLIVSWIKANLYIHVSRELWDELVDVLSSLCHWEELVQEWAKNMEIMTRVMSRHVYKLDLHDLPLDRLTEQKHKKQKAGHMTTSKSGKPLLSERSFSRAWSRDSGPSASSDHLNIDTRCRIRSEFLSHSRSADENRLTTPVPAELPSKTSSAESMRHRSSTVPSSPATSCTGNTSLSPKRGVSETQFVNSNSSGESNTGSLKRHNSASDISSRAKDHASATSPLRHRSDSESQGLEKNRSLKNGPRVAWQEPTHEVHNYLSRSVDASESNSVSVNSLEDEDEDEFDALVNERLHSDHPDRKRLDESWRHDVTSLHSQDSASIDPDWNPWVDQPVQQRLEETEIIISDGSIQQPTHVREVKQNKRHDSSGLQADDQGLSDGACHILVSPPYQLYQNKTQQRNDSSAILIAEDPSLVSPTGETISRDPAMSVDDPPPSIQGTATPVYDAASIDTCDIDVGMDTADHEADYVLATSSDEILLQQCSTSHASSSETNIQSNGRSTASSSQTVLIGEDVQSDADDRSVMAGGKNTGWCPDVSVALWRRLLGVLGDINNIEDGYIHKLVFHYLLKLWETLWKMRQNIGIVTDSQTPADNQELVPPLRIFSPWAFKAAFNLPPSHKEGKLYAFQILCKMTIKRQHDITLGEVHLAQFYAVLHESLHSQDQDIVNKIIGSCSHYFPSCLPASTLLMLDFLYACHAVAASSDLKAPRVEAQTILGSTLCFPNIYRDIPVLKPDSAEPSTKICNNIEDYVVDALLTSGKKEPSAAARCVALSSTGVWLFEELTSNHKRHPRVKEAINVLLVSLKFSNRTVASVACSQLHLLTHCSDSILSTMPDMPARIIEVVSLTVSALLNTTELKNSEPGKQLLVSLILCILDWCMAVPLELLTETYGVQSDKRLIRTVFKALQTAALGKPGHSAKHSYSLTDLASQDFDPNLQLDKVLETPLGGINKVPKPPLTRSPTTPLGKDGAVSLIAHTVLNHLTNHLGHFPLARGTSVLTSRVSEHHDVIDAPDELSDTLFNSPDVQFLIYNDACLLSVVEIPAEDGKPGGGATAGMTTSDRCVRFIVRDAGGKYCWDSSILYGPPDVEDATKPVSCKPLSILDEAVSKAAKECCASYIDYANIEAQTKRTIVRAAIPQHDNDLAEGCPDRLDQLLQYIGWTSPECQSRIGFPLNIPALPPSCLSEELQTDASKCTLQLHETLGGSSEQNAFSTSWQGSVVQPLQTVQNHLPFYHARLLCAEMGFLSRDNRHRVNLLTKNERLLRELKNLDARNCRETHKVAVLYIAEGQEDKVLILSNTRGSEDFETFVAGLGWEVDLSTHCGFRGKLQKDGSNGQTTPYYATSTLEVVYHVSTRFPSTDEDARNVKIRHLGNDEVHIVWSEHHRDYRRGIIPTEFGDVLIVIYPIRHGLYRIQITKKQDIPYFGPLFDGAVVNGRVLPILVRETAINAGRAKRSLIHLYQPFYEERTRYLRQIVEQFKDERSFEDYSSNLFCPAPARKRKKETRSVPLSSASLMENSSTAGTASLLSTDTLNTNRNNTSDASRFYPFKDTSKRTQVSTPSLQLDTLQVGTHTHHPRSRPAPLPPSSTNKLSTTSMPSSIFKGPTPSGTPSPVSPAPVFFPPPAPDTSLETVNSSFGGLRNSRAVPPIPPRDFPDIRDFPSPPRSPPMDPRTLAS